MNCKSIHKVINGKLTNSEQLKNNLDLFEGKVIEMHLKEYKHQRSNEQNRYYWGVIVKSWQEILKQEWGEYRSLNEVHEFLKQNLNYEEKICELTGEVLTLSKSTTKNDTKQQEEYHERCRQLAFENFQIMIQLPNEQTNLL